MKNVCALEENEYFPIILQHMNPMEIKNPYNEAFFISLMICDLILLKYMPGSSMNDVPLVMM